MEHGGSYKNAAFDINEEALQVTKEETGNHRSSFTLHVDDNVPTKATPYDVLKKFYRRHQIVIRRTLWILAFLLYNAYLASAIGLTWNTTPAVAARDFPRPVLKLSTGVPGPFSSNNSRALSGPGPVALATPTQPHCTPAWCEGVRFLVLLTSFVYGLLLYRLVLKKFLVQPLLKTARRSFGKCLNSKYLPWVLWLGLLAVALVFLVLDTRGNRIRLVSGGGLAILIALGYLGSAHRKRVVWRHVLWGVLLQFLLGLLLLRWQTGRAAFQCLGDKIEAFLAFTDAGTEFVFSYLVSGKITGTPTQIPVFAFKVLSVIIFFSFCISILYHYGTMQWLVTEVGWLLQKTVGTTACESINAAGNIFLGMTEAPIMIKPYLPVMTKSELHAVMTGGFATIAGSVLAAYINFGVSASHLLSASVMSAPAALAYAKLTYPETEVSRTKTEDISDIRGPEHNAMEAAANGASFAISLVANITANLIAFLAFITFADSLLGWFGSLVALEGISFEWLLSKLFIPLAFIMGVEWSECEYVGRLVGLKTVVNEFVAYKTLGDLKEEGVLSPRSQIISTYALCGFSNIASIGIQLGGLGAMAPERKSDLASVGLRACVAGSAACFMTACIAGVLLDDLGSSTDFRENCTTIVPTVHNVSTSWT